MRTTCLWLAAGLLLLGCAGPAPAFDAWMEPDDNEEPAGGAFQFFGNSDDDVYGISGSFGVWIRGTPLFGDYFVSLFRNGIEDAFYSGMGLTVRLMPHTSVAPFVGGGGSYNYSMSDEGEDGTETMPVVEPEDAELPYKGESYWAGHAEAGIRFWVPAPLRLVELSGRYTWSAHDGDRDYWTAGLAMGGGF